MRADFLVSLDLDSDWAEAIAKHRRCQRPAVVAELVRLLEARLADDVKHVDGVAGPVCVKSHIDGRPFEWKPSRRDRSCG